MDEVFPGRRLGMIANGGVQVQRFQCRPVMFYPPERAFVYGNRASNLMVLRKAMIRGAGERGQRSTVIGAPAI
jgi:hypothetical protein